MVSTKPELNNHLNLKTYWGEDYEVYKNYILYKDLIINIPNNQIISKQEKDFEELNFEFGISNYCNLRCKYCFADHNNPKSFNADEHIKMIERIVNHFGEDKRYWFFLNGDGEILNKPKEVEKISKYCVNHKYKFTIRTNGTFGFFNNLKKLKNAICFDYSFSYDGENSKDRVFKNGKETGKIVRKNIENVIKVNKRAEVNSVINQDSEDIYNIISDLKNIGVKETYFTPQKNKIYNESEIEKIIENYRNFYIKSFNDYKDNKIFDFMSFCSSGIPVCDFSKFNHYFKVDKDGYLSKCSYLFQKIKIEDFSYEKLESEEKILECNKNCLFSNYCKGNFCAGLDSNLGCQLRKVYFEFLCNILIYYKEKHNIDINNLF